MRLPTKVDPYSGFKDDNQRRRALATKVRWTAFTVMVVAVSGAPIEWIGCMRWMMNLFH